MRAYCSLEAPTRLERLRRLSRPASAPERTNATNEHRINRVAGVEIEDIVLEDWPMRELRRRHTLALVDHKLRNEGRAATGAVGILSLSAMAEDVNHRRSLRPQPFKGIRIRASDPRARRSPPDPGLHLR
jgi:hypothetical protein